MLANAHLPTAAPTAFRAVETAVPEPAVTHATARMPTVADPLSALQHDYDTAMDVPPSFDERFHNILLETGNLETTIPNSKVKFFRDRLRTVHGNDQLNKFSRLRTLQPWPRPSTQKQLLLGLQKRNCNTSRYTAAFDPEAAAVEVAEYFFDTYCTPDWRTRTAAMRTDPIRVSASAIDDYLITAEPAKFRAVQQARLAANAPDVFRVDPTDLANYFVMFRREPKNRLSRDAIGEYQILQTVIHHAPKVNVVCSFFRQMFDRLQSLFKPNVFVQLRKSIDELEAHLNEFVPYWALGFENDFEKFDKSQLEECARLELAILRILGLDDLLRALWEHGLTDTTAINFLLGIIIYLLFQRKTGSVMTSFGNVLINMASAAWVYKLREVGFISVYFVGDDSYLFVTKLPDPTAATIAFALRFNLIGKVMHGLGNYFCSSFLVHSGARWLVYPDPVKKIERLSYPLNLQAGETLFDRWQSFCDACRNYADAAGCRALAMQVRLRYPGVVIENSLVAIATILGSYRQFESLFY
jgi:hypothetical protein